MQPEELKRIADSVDQRRGWDFSRVRDEVGPVPWDYMEIARRYLSPMQHVLDIGTGGQYQEEPGQTVADWAKAFAAWGVAIWCRGEYDVPYTFLDVESLIFWLKAIPMPEDFDVERHWPQVNAILVRHQTPRGIVTNEHRELLIVRKP